MINWAALAALCSLVGVLATIVGVAFTSGRLTERLRENQEKTEVHAVTLEKHAERLDDHTLRVDRLEQWREGFNAAAYISGGSKIAKNDRNGNG